MPHKCCFNSGGQFYRLIHDAENKLCIQCQWHRVGYVLVDQLECVQGQMGLDSEQPGIVGVPSTPTGSWNWMIF